MANDIIAKRASYWGAHQEYERYRGDTAFRLYPAGPAASP